MLARPGPVLLLAGVDDPGNAGTLVRSAEAFGAAGVLFGRGGVDPYAPKVVRAAMGSLFRLPVAPVEPAELLAAARAAGRPLVATEVEGEDLRTRGVPAGRSSRSATSGAGCGTGCPRWDRLVRIPPHRLTESLNAAVAGSIVLYESSRCQDPCQVAEKA